MDAFAHLIFLLLSRQTDSGATHHDGFREERARTSRLDNPARHVSSSPWEEVDNPKLIADDSSNSSSNVS